MKKLVFAALAIGAMAACTKSAVQYEQTGEICLQPVAQKATKAAVDGAVYPTTESFNVWAKWGQQGKGSVSATDATAFDYYIYEGTFVNRENTNNWGGSTPYYWPTTGSLIFAGYSPASAKVDGTNFGYNFSTGTFSVENYVQSENIRETKDLMWFDFNNQSYNMNLGTASTPVGVPATFKHALSWLTFKFNLEGTTTPRNWVVTNVTLKGIETKGSFDSISAGDKWTLSTEDNFKNKDITVYNGDKEIEHSTTPEALENTPNGVLVIPQACDLENAKLIVTYNLKKQGVPTQSGVSDYIEGQTVTLDLSVVDSDKWLPGKHYIYTIIFGANEILISPSVTDWVDEEVNIDVQ